VQSNARGKNALPQKVFFCLSSTAVICGVRLDATIVLTGSMMAIVWRLSPELGSPAQNANKKTIQLTIPYASETTEE
jgi:hypothetical protein